MGSNNAFSDEIMSRMGWMEDEYPELEYLRWVEPHDVKQMLVKGWKMLHPPVQDGRKHRYLMWRSDEPD